MALIGKDMVMVPSRITEMQQGHDGYEQVQTEFEDLKIWTTHVDAAGNNKQRYLFSILQSEMITIT